MSQEGVLKYLQKHTIGSVKEISEDLEISKEAVRRNLSMLGIHDEVKRKDRILWALK